MKATSKTTGLFDCERCGKMIVGNSNDPVVHTRLGRMHYDCNQDAWAEQEGKKVVRKHKVETKPIEVVEEEAIEEVVEANEEKRTVTCKLCGQRGHNSRSCGTPKKEKSDRTVTCKACGEAGHNRRTCRKTAA